MHTTLKVFVSSTWIDLQSERQAIAETTHKMTAFSFVGMENFGSCDLPPEDGSLDKVDTCDLYVCIVGNRYGSGITEKEYDRARRLNLPCFIYFLRSESVGAKADANLLVFSNRLRNSHICSDFGSPDELALKMATDLHNWLFSRGINKGLTALGSNYRSRVQSFVDEYLGNRERVVPFGGRTAELAQLQQWLIAGNTSPFMLVTSSAGRGKSALLVQWAKHLQGDNSIAVLFFPVSIRFRTNLAGVVFCSIATYLSNLHGEQVSVEADAAPEIWRGLMLEYMKRPLLDGRQLLVIIDGLDEAADWKAGLDLFPSQIARTCKVLASARLLAGDIGPDSWLRRLGWDSVGGVRTMGLPLLTESAVRHVLLRTGVPLNEIAANPKLVAELYRLSEGDPLLVRLYVAELWSLGEAATNLTIDDLQKIAPGLEGFFTRWWEDQRTLWDEEHPLREKSVQAIASALACAFGPMTRDDLFNLVGEDAGLSIWTFDDAIEPLRRFIIGDGEKQGYVFSHPQLGLYFKERMSNVERKTFEQKFLSWGTNTITALANGKITASETSQYLVQHFSAHLMVSKAKPDEFAVLVSDEWRRARYHHEGTYAGFSSDLRIVIDTVSEANEAALTKNSTPALTGLLVSSASCLNSIAEIGRKTPPQFVIAAIRLGLWPLAAATVYARMIEDPLHRAQVFVYMADAAGKDSQIKMLDEAMVALLDFVQFVTSYEMPHIEAEYLKVLNEIFRLLPGHALAGSLKLIKPLSYAGKQTAMLSVINRAPDDLLHVMLDAVVNLVDESRQRNCLKALGARYPKQALNIAEQQHQMRVDAWQQAWMLMGVASFFDHDQCHIPLTRAAEIASTITDNYTRAELLVEIVAHPRNSDTDFYDQAVYLVQQVTYSKPRAQLLVRLAKGRQGKTSRELAEQSLAAIESISSEFWRASILSEFAPLVNVENSDKVMAILTGIDNETVLVKTVASLIEYLPNDKHDRALELVEPIDRFTQLTGFAAAPAYAPEPWILSIPDLYRKDGLSEEWVYSLLRSYAPTINFETQSALVEQLSAFGPDSALSAIAALIPYTDQHGEQLEMVFARVFRGTMGEILTEHLRFIEEVILHASAELVACVFNQIQASNSRLRTRILSLLAPHLTKDKVQQGIRSFQTIDDLVARRSFYVRSFEYMGGGALRGELPSLWEQLDPADKLNLLLTDANHTVPSGNADVIEMFELVKHITDEDRKAFLFLKLLKKLELGALSSHWSDIISMMNLLERTYSSYAKESFSFIIGNAPTELVLERFQSLLKQAIKLESPELNKMLNLVPEAVVSKTVNQLNKKEQLYVLLNTDVKVEFDMDAFIEEFGEHGSRHVQWLIEVCLQVADTYELKVNWAKLIAVVLDKSMSLEQRALKAILRYAPHELIVDTSDRLLARVRFSHLEPDIATTLFKIIPRARVAQAIEDQWLHDLKDIRSGSFFWDYEQVYGPRSTWEVLSEWAVLASKDNLDLIAGRLAKSLTEVGEDARYGLLLSSDWNPKFVPYLIEHCCNFENSKLKAVGLLRLLPAASTTQVPTILNWIQEFVDADVPRARRTFKDILDARVQWLVGIQWLKMAVLVELLITTTGRIQRHVAQHALRALEAVDPGSNQTKAAQILWQHLPVAMRPLLQAITPDIDVQVARIQPQPDESIATDQSTIVDDVEIKYPSKDSDSQDTPWIRQAFKVGELPENWREKFLREYEKKGGVGLANSIADAIVHESRATEIGYRFWQLLISESTTTGRAVLVEILTALVPATRMLFGEDALRDHVLGIDKCASWWP